MKGYAAEWYVAAAYRTGHIKGGIIILTIEASEALPLLLFISIGAMIAAVMLGFDLKDAASIGIIGAADGPTSILVSQVLHSNYIGPIAVAAYSYMALVPIIQPFAIKLVTTKKERAMHMPYNPKHVSRALRINVPFEQAKKMHCHIRQCIQNKSSWLPFYRPYSFASQTFD